MSPGMDAQLRDDLTDVGEHPRVIQLGGPGTGHEGS